MKKQINPSIKAQILRSAFILLALAAVSAIPFALAQSRSRGTAKRSVAASAIRVDRTLTFADRVAYQRAIEEDYWQRPITPDQLQAEIERMASHTKQPGVLREIFAALGNDPLVIAECLARPVLAERLITELYAHDSRFHGELKRRAEADLRTHPSVREMKQTSGMYTEMEWIKSDSTPDQNKGGSASPEDDGKANGQRPGTEPNVKLNSREWNESVGKLAEQFRGSRQREAAAFGVRRYSAAFESADMSAHSKNAAAADEY